MIADSPRGASMRRGRRLATGRPEAARVGLLAPEIAVKSWPPRTRRSQGAMLVPASGWLLSAPAGEPAPAPRRPARQGVVARGPAPRAGSGGSPGARGAAGAGRVAGAVGARAAAERPRTGRWPAFLEALLAAGWVGCRGGVRCPLWLLPLRLPRLGSRPLRCGSALAASAARRRPSRRLPFFADGTAGTARAVLAGALGARCSPCVRIGRAATGARSAAGFSHP